MNSGACQHFFLDMRGSGVMLGASRSSPDPDNILKRGGGRRPLRRTGSRGRRSVRRMESKRFTTSLLRRSSFGYEGWKARREGMTEAGRTLGELTVDVAVVLWAVNAVLLVVYLIWGRRTRDKGSEGQKDKGKNRDQ